MPRHNLYTLWFLGLFCLLCSSRSDPLGYVLSQTLRRIQSRYIEAVDDEKLFEGAVDGMIYTLKNEFGDEHSAYIPPSLSKESDRELNKEFSGIGIETCIDQKTGQLTVLSPMYGSPASQGGIRANDRIIAIDGKSIKNLSFDKAMKKIQGKKGAPIVLRIQRPIKNEETKLGKNDSNGSIGEKPKEFDVTLHRADVRIDTVLGDRRHPDGSWDFMLEGEDKIGYLRIASFAKYTAEEFENAIDQLQRQGMKGLVIDLRDNPGGYLDWAVTICDKFIDSGIIVSTRSRSSRFVDWIEPRKVLPGEDTTKSEAESKPKKKSDQDAVTKSKRFDIRDEFFATEKGTLDKKIPVAVLINGESASAAEIMAACLQDHHRAKIVGTRSYGKGTVQEVLPVGGSLGELHLTSASYWRPSGKNINRSKDAKENEDWGVRPDSGFEVPVDPDTRKIFVVTRLRRDINYNDAQEIPDKAREVTVKENEGNTSNGETKTEPKKLLPLIDPKTPMIDVDPQLRKAVEWVKKKEV